MNHLNRRFTIHSLIPMLLAVALVQGWAMPADARWQSGGKSQPTGQSTTKTKAKANSKAKPKAKPKAESEAKDRPLEPWEKFVPTFVDDDLAGSSERAWEYRPYKVACWFCLDGSPKINAIYPQAAAEIIQRSELLDASGWDLTIGEAPAKFRHLFLKYIQTPERCTGFTNPKVLGNYDKLMIVCLKNESSLIQASVREFDVQTQQWGPINNRTIAFNRSAGQQLMDAIGRSFMPLAQIERVTEVAVEINGKKNRKDEVLMQLRAVQSCVRTKIRSIETNLTVPVSTGLPGDDLTDSIGQADAESPSTNSADPQFAPTVLATKSSPAFISSRDLFLPVIRRTDRYKNLLGLEPLEFTFLTVDRQDGAEVRASIHSRGRAPLNQRKSKRAKKLALVIRPPQESTTLRLVSREKQPIPMEGFSIYERPVNQPDHTRDVLVGKSDWKGEFEVQPSENGLRILIIQRGGRRLNRLPVVPGLYQSVQTPLRNDETRLYAQGVFKGFENELLGLVIQRQVARSKLEDALAKKVPVLAKQSLNELRDLEKLEELRERMNLAVNDLSSQTDDKTELKYINLRQDALLKLIVKKVGEEQKIHYDPKTKQYGKSYIEQVQDLEASAGSDSKGSDSKGSDSKEAGSDLK